MADESLEGEKLKPGRACEGSRQDLIKCLRESDCVKVVCHGHVEEGEGEGVEHGGESLRFNTLTRDNRLLIFRVFFLTH